MGHTFSHTHTHARKLKNKIYNVVYFPHKHEQNYVLLFRNTLWKRKVLVLSLAPGKWIPRKCSKTTWMSICVLGVERMWVPSLNTSRMCDQTEIKTNLWAFMRKILPKSISAQFRSFCVNNLKPSKCIAVKRLCLCHHFEWKTNLKSANLSSSTIHIFWWFNKRKTAIYWKIENSNRQINEIRSCTALERFSRHK